eukprot:4848097-Pleurochrysis_carterae.AAC.1
MAKALEKEVAGRCRLATSTASRTAFWSAYLQLRRACQLRVCLLQRRTAHVGCAASASQVLATIKGYADAEQAPSLFTT